MSQKTEPEHCVEIKARGSKEWLPYLSLPTKAEALSYAERLRETVRRKRLLTHVRVVEKKEVSHHD
jgi:hypothetical protein